MLLIRMRCKIEAGGRPGRCLVPQLGAVPAPSPACPTIPRRSTCQNQYNHASAGAGGKSAFHTEHDWPAASASVSTWKYLSNRNPFEAPAQWRTASPAKIRLAMPTSHTWATSLMSAPQDIQLQQDSLSRPKPCQPSKSSSKTRAPPRAEPTMSSPHHLLSMEGPTPLSGL